MQTIENVIVTLWISGKSVDMELPTFLPIQELRVKVRDTMRALSPGKYDSAQSVTLKYKSVTLGDEETLASCGVWDGSIIEGLPE